MIAGAIFLAVARSTAFVPTSTSAPALRLPIRDLMPRRAPCVNTRRAGPAGPTRLPTKKCGVPMCALSEEQRSARFASWFRDRKGEVLKPVELTVEGKAPPPYLEGALVRNGPAVWKGKDREYEHAFDGLAKLMRFAISEGRVSYSSKFLKSLWYQKVVVEEEPLPPSVTVGRVTPPFSQLENIKGLMTSSLFDNAPVNIHQFGGPSGPWAAITDAPLALEFDPQTLETKGRLDTAYTNSVVSLGGFELFSTAHPSRCPLTQQTLNYFLELRPLGPSNTALLVRTDKDLRRSVPFFVLMSYFSWISTSYEIQ